MIPLDADASAPPPIRFGAFELDLRTGELRKSGMAVNLPPQPFKILALLTSRAGTLVTREEIHRQIWGEETFVDFEQGLNFAIKKIRAALGDDAEKPRYVETLPRRGYRFIAPVVPPDPEDDEISTTAEAHEGTQRAVTALVDAVVETHRSRARWRVAVVALAMVGAGALLAAFMDSGQTDT
jgi:DNA-binding winged helix-turn-helix (wHTH) protein